MTTADEVLGFLQAQRSAMEEMLSELVMMETPSTDPDAQQEILTYLAQAFGELGYRTIIVPGRTSGGHLYASPRRRTRDRPTQLLLGHCDTVWPSGTLVRMPLERRGNQIHGPGIYDMKAGLVEMIFALKAMAGLELEPAVVPIAFINSDEEIGSRESTRYVRALARNADRALVLEPSLGVRGRIKTARKGVGRFTITVTGKAAHAGLDPGAGASAILELSHVIQKLFSLNDPDRGVSVNVGVIDGGVRANVVAPQSSAVVDVRVETKSDAESIEAAIHGLTTETPGVEVAIEGRIGRPPMEKTPANRQLWNVAVDLAKRIGLEIDEGTAGGGSDGNTTSQYTARLARTHRCDRVAGTLRVADFAADGVPAERSGAARGVTMNRYILSSVTRIADLSGRLETQALPKDAWATGDYVVGEVTDVRGRLQTVELPTGRMMEVMAGDLVVGAWGARAATLEIVGDWAAIEGTTFDALTPAGLFGRVTSISPFQRPMMQLEYRGHVIRGGRKLTMGDCIAAANAVACAAPVVLIVGTSMSAGKTLSARLIIHLLSQAGKTVVGAKLTGAARYRDVLSFEDAGATRVFDFVDVGLPSTVCDQAIYRHALDVLLARIAEAHPDVVVAEAGASPLEPYNGDTAIEMLGDRIRFMVLCAQDPYAVLGVQQAFQCVPDVVAGGAANTSAGAELVAKLTGLQAINLLDPTSHETLAGLLDAALV